jgi:hypothetical protein
MEKAEVIFTPNASGKISKIAQFIEEKGYPETAEKFALSLYEFGSSLGLMPRKYPL